MDYEGFFRARLAALHAEGRYRGFADLARHPPAAQAHVLRVGLFNRWRDRAERVRHEERAATLKRRLAEAGLPVMPSPSHIVPVLIADPVLCKAVCGELLHRHRIMSSRSGSGARDHLVGTRSAAGRVASAPRNPRASSCNASPRGKVRRQTSTSSRFGSGGSKRL